MAKWRRLREASEVERRTERKKEALRNSVRLVLPDFKPAVPVPAFRTSAVHVYRLVTGTGPGDQATFSLKTYVLPSKLWSIYYRQILGLYTTV